MVSQPVPTCLFSLFPSSPLPCSANKIFLTSLSQHTHTNMSSRQLLPDQVFFNVLWMRNNLHLSKSGTVIQAAPWPRCSSCAWHQTIPKQPSVDVIIAYVTLTCTQFPLNLCNNVCPSPTPCLLPPGASHPSLFSCHYCVTSLLGQEPKRKMNPFPPHRGKFFSYFNSGI